MTHNSPKSHTEVELIQAFKDAGDKLVTLMANENFETRLTLDPDLPQFTALPADRKRITLQRLQTLLSLCQKTLARGQTLTDATALLKTFFDQYSFSSAEGLFERLQADDSIDAYDTNHQLIFANLGLFRAISFTLEDVYCRPWMQMVTRDTRGVHEALLKLGTEILEGSRTSITSTAFIPDHVGRELNSPENRSIIIFPQFFAPLYHERKIAGYICVNKLFPHIESRSDFER